MVAIARGPSSLRSATICTSRLPSSTTSLGHTKSINSRLGTTRSRRSTSASSTSNAREPTLAGVPSISTLRRIASISMAPLRYVLLDRVGLASSMAVRLGRLLSGGKRPPARLIRINARPNDPKRRLTDHQLTARISRRARLRSRRGYVRAVLREGGIGIRYDSRIGTWGTWEPARYCDTRGGPSANRGRVRILFVLGRLLLLQQRGDARLRLRLVLRDIVTRRDGGAGRRR